MLYFFYLRGNNIICTMWAEVVDEVLHAWLYRSNHPIVIIVQLCRSKVYQG